MPPVREKPQPFKNRFDAGRLLAKQLKNHHFEKPLVLALPRGGVPIAAEIARTLRAPLEVIGVKKMGAPHNPEFAIGAVVEDGTYVLNPSILGYLDLSESKLKDFIKVKSIEAQRAGNLFRSGRPLPDLRDKTVIVADDGLATGMTAMAVIKFLKEKQVRKSVFAAPVCSPETVKRLSDDYQSVICVSQPDFFHAVGTWYDDFTQVTDEEVFNILKEFQGPATNEINIPAGSVYLKGLYQKVPNARATIVFVHGSGSGRLSPRNQKVAAALSAAGLSTLLFDLLTEAESADRKNVFDIHLLSDRLVEVSHWLTQQDSDPKPIAYFGASTGAAAALDAAAKFKNIYAIVSRGGRPDLATHPEAVDAPTLLIVGSEDHLVLELNRRALGRLKNGKLEIVPKATHLFEEPGTLDQVIDLARSWFTDQLDRSRTSTNQFRSGT